MPPRPPALPRSAPVPPPRTGPSRERRGRDRRRPRRARTYWGPERRRGERRRGWRDPLESRRSRAALRAAIYLLLALTFVAGLPALHYATAVMVALLVRQRDVPGGLTGRVASTPLPPVPRPWHLDGGRGVRGTRG